MLQQLALFFCVLCITKKLNIKKYSDIAEWFILHTISIKHDKI